MGKKIFGMEEAHLAFLLALFSLLVAIASAAFDYFEWETSNKGYVVKVADEYAICEENIHGTGGVYFRIGLKNLGEKSVESRVSVISDYIEFDEQNISYIIESEAIKDNDAPSYFSFSGGLRLTQPYPAHVNYTVAWECVNKDCTNNRAVVAQCNYDRNETMESQGYGKPYYELVEE